MSPVCAITVSSALKRRWIPLSVATWLILSMLAAMAVTPGLGEDPLNNSNSGGLHWLSAKEEGDLVRESEESLVAMDNDDFDGGFSSLEGMLQWSIGHADPTKLKEASLDAERLSSDELEKRQLEIKEILEELKTPSDAQLMQISIADLNNSSLPLEDHHRALQELLILVETIDNANDMNKFGGHQAVIRELRNSDEEIRILSAWILGKASQNNPVVQNQILELGALTLLMKMVNSSGVEEATKGLYAVSALIRSNIDGQELFYAKSGQVMLQDIMSNSSADIGLKKKAVSLVDDLAIFQLETEAKAETPSSSSSSSSSLSSSFFLKSVVDLTTSTDIDLQEKALLAIKSLLKLKGTKAEDFRDVCGLEKVLERMREQLVTNQSHTDFLVEMEGLLAEVVLIFQHKLHNVPQV